MGLFCLIKYLAELTMNQPPFLHASSPAATMEYPEFSARERAHAVVGVRTCSCGRQNRWKWSHPDWLAENIYGSGVRERHTVARARNLHLSVWGRKTSVRLAAVFKSCLNALNDRSLIIISSSFIKLFSIKRTGPPTARQTRLTIRTFTKITDHRERRRAPYCSNSRIEWSLTSKT